MSAFGELIIVAIYFVLGLSAIGCLLKTFIIKAKLPKFLCLLGFVVCTSLLFLFWTNNKRNHRIAELENVGVYYLTNYTNCDSCKLTLKEDNSYEVTNGTKVIETGNWHYESGGDYWIVYMNDNEDQLGNGRFTYEEYNNRYKAANNKSTEAK